MLFTVRGMAMEKQWSELTPAEKRQKRFRDWLKPVTGFDSPEAEKAYNTRLKRLSDTLLRKKTDRVPVTLPVDNFPALYAGVTFHQVMYDYDALYNAWPGHGLPLNATGHQFVEGEYMKEDEYGALLADPSDYMMRVFLPRALGALEPFRKLPPLTSLLGRPQGLLMTAGQPDIQAAFLALADAGKEMSKYQQVIMKFGREAQAAAKEYGKY
jgi:hypothetical protein